MLDRRIKRLTPQDRKLDTRRKIQLGGLVRLAGLDTPALDEMALLGGLLAVREALRAKPENAAIWRIKGVEMAERRKREKHPNWIAITIRFQVAPPTHVRDGIKALGFSYVDEHEWRGLVETLDLVKSVVEAWGGIVNVRK